MEVTQGPWTTAGDRRVRDDGAPLLLWPVWTGALVPLLVPVVVGRVRDLDAHRTTASTGWTLALAALGIVLGALGPGVVIVRARRSSAPLAAGAPAAVGLLLGVFALMWAVHEEFGESFHPTADPTGRISAGLLVALGLVLAVVPLLVAVRRDRSRRPAPDAWVSGAAVPDPPPPPPRPTGVDRWWWCGGVIGVGGAVLQVVVARDRFAALLAGTDLSWTTLLDALVLVAWVAVTVAFLRTPRDVPSWPDPLLALGPAARRRLQRSLADGTAIPPELRPTARAHLERELGHRRRRFWAEVAVGVGLVHDPSLGPVAVGIAALAVVAVVVVLRSRRRAARRLAVLRPA